MTGPPELNVESATKVEGLMEKRNNTFIIAAASWAGLADAICQIQEHDRPNGWGKGGQSVTECNLRPKDISDTVMDYTRR